MPRLSRVHQERRRRTYRLAPLLLDPLCGAETSPSILSFFSLSPFLSRHFPPFLCLLMSPLPLYHFPSPSHPLHYALSLSMPSRYFLLLPTLSQHIHSLPYSWRHSLLSLLLDVLVSITPCRYSSTLSPFRPLCQSAAHPLVAPSRRLISRAIISSPCFPSAYSPSSLPPCPGAVPSFSTPATRAACHLVTSATAVAIPPSSPSRARGDPNCTALSRPH